MKKTLVKRKNAAGGFTLLEVLLVITIIGILAAFVVPNLMGIGDEARKDAARASVGKSGSLASAIGVFQLKIGRLPTTDEGLKALIEKPDDTPEFERWVQMIDDATMLKDPWGEEYQYRGPDSAEFNKDRYDLFSKGPDKEEGTDDDLGNWTKES